MASPCICRSSERRHSMLIHLNAFQPLSPWAAAMHLPFARSETQKYSPPRVSVATGRNLKCVETCRRTGRRQRQQGEEWRPNADGNVMRGIKAPSRPCANNLVHVSSPAPHPRLETIESRSSRSALSPTMAARRPPAVSLRSICRRRSKRSQRRGVPGLFEEWAGMKREEGEAKVLLSTFSPLARRKRPLRLHSPLAVSPLTSRRPLQAFLASPSSAAQVGVAARPQPGWRGRFRVRPGWCRPGLCHSWSNQPQPERLRLVGKRAPGAPTSKKKDANPLAALDQASSCDHVGGRICCSFLPLLPSGRILQRFGSTLAPVFAD